jgi:hypothetical protein
LRVRYQSQLFKEHFVSLQLLLPSQVSAPNFDNRGWSSLPTRVLQPLAVSPSCFSSSNQILPDLIPVFDLGVQR